MNFLDRTNNKKSLTRIAVALCFGGLANSRLKRSVTLANGEWSALVRALQTLTPREERVLRLRYGLQMTQADTAQAVGQWSRKPPVSVARIHQIQQRALSKLRHPSRKLHWNNWRVASDC